MATGAYLRSGSHGIFWSPPPVIQERKELTIPCSGFRRKIQTTATTAIEVTTGAKKIVRKAFLPRMR